MSINLDELTDDQYLAIYDFLLEVPGSLEGSILDSNSPKYQQDSQTLFILKREGLLGLETRYVLTDKGAALLARYENTENKERVS